MERVGKSKRNPGKGLWDGILRLDWRILRVFGKRGDTKEDKMKTKVGRWAIRIKEKLKKWVEETRICVEGRGDSEKDLKKEKKEKDKGMNFQWCKKKEERKRRN